MVGTVIGPSSRDAKTREHRTDGVGNIPLFFLLVLAVCMIGNAGAAVGDGPDGVWTGAPLEDGCDETACAGTVIDWFLSGDMDITMDAPQHYVPGDEYRITVTLERDGHGSSIMGGFQLTSVNSTGNDAGAMTPALGTSITMGSMVAPDLTTFNRTYLKTMSHVTMEDGEASWTLTWTAPDSDLGPITIHAGGVAHIEDAPAETLVQGSVVIHPMPTATLDMAKEFEPGVPVEIVLDVTHPGYTTLGYEVHANLSQPVGVGSFTQDARTGDVLTVDPSIKGYALSDTFIDPDGSWTEAIYWVPPDAHFERATITATITTTHPTGGSSIYTLEHTITGETIPRVYLGVGLFIIISAAFPIVSFYMTRILRPRDRGSLSGPVSFMFDQVHRQKGRNQIKTETYECGESPIGEAHVQFHFQYYMFAILFVAFDLLAAFFLLYGYVYSGLGDDLVAKGTIWSFLGMLCLGLVYMFRKEDVIWV